ncbi:FAD-dependent oxidoreductase [Endozoicomonas sp. ONNA1]|uniref:FAD-dependent oxidoreductase n=2 Tax=unclassified Endozoicomonas TaxID=2644528 RepID=UPI00214911CB|nr:FAD-dependent oxidoreductase [Endozoicomonas sp. ONNA1]
MKYKNINKLTACLLLTLFLSPTLRALTPSVVVVGGGPAAMTAAQTIARFNPSVTIRVIKSHKSQGQLEGAGTIENWPGSLTIKGSSLQKLMEDKASSNPNVQIIEDHIVETQLKGTLKVLQGERSAYYATLVILASGAKPNLPTILEPYKGNGVFTCTDCDGPRFAEKDVLVVGGGASAIEQAISLLSLNANKVHLAVQGSSFKAESIMIDLLYNALERRKKALFLYFEHNLESIYINQNGLLNASTLSFEGGRRRLSLPVSGVFSAIGQKPQSGIYPDICLNNKDYIQRYDFNQTPWSQPLMKSNMLTLGSVDSPFVTLLMAAARGTTSAQWLNKTVTKSVWSKRRVAILGAGIGGKTAALYASRSGFDVVLIDTRNRKPLKSFWPVPDTESSLLISLDKQLLRLSVSTITADTITLMPLENLYRVQADNRSIMVDGVIANTLEYSPEDLGIGSIAPESLDNEYRWSHTCQSGVLTAGDVAVHHDLPRQAITASYSGYLAGLRALEEILMMEAQEALLNRP